MATAPATVKIIKLNEGDKMHFDYRLDAAALRFAADILESAINAGDIAEVAAPVEGESGRSEAVATRDEIYEDPAGWLRGQADGLEADHENRFAE